MDTPSWEPGDLNVGQLQRLVTDALADVKYQGATLEALAELVRESLYAATGRNWRVTPPTPVAHGD